MTQLSTTNDTQLVKIKAGAAAELVWAEALVVEDEQSLRDAAEHLRWIAGWKKMVTELLAPMKAALKMQESCTLGPFKKADKVLRDKVSAYQESERRRIREETARREAAERARREEQQLAMAATLEAQAVDSDDEDLKRAAEELLNAPVQAPVVPVEEMTKLEGVGSRKPPYAATLVDFQQLVEAVAANLAPIQALKADMSWLNREAKQRGAMVGEGGELLPGVMVTVKAGSLVVRAS